MRPTREQVAERLIYEPSTGVFRWRKQVGQLTKGGSVAGGVNSHGYHRISILDRAYATHRLAWLLMTGEWPADQIDHIDGNKSNNAWSNLRAATGKQNCANKKTTNRLGLKGVRLDKRWQRYYAQIEINGRSKHLGSFGTAEAAHDAYMKAAREVFGEFASDGKRRV